jgi:TRAP-type C4-dicarboxylate transport system permease small subunit
MSGGHVPIAGQTPPEQPTPADRLMHAANRAAVGVGMVALVAACVVLTYSVVSRYLFKASTDWQDESAVFLLVGVTFLCAPWVQQQRGHIGIEAIVGLLSPRINRARRIGVDTLCLLFCGFFAWKSWKLLHEAVADGQTTSSSWAPPLWIPYGLMTLGMTLLTLQIALQLWPRGHVAQPPHEVR